MCATHTRALPLAVHITHCGLVFSCFFIHQQQQQLWFAWYYCHKKKTVRHALLMPWTWGSSISLITAVSRCVAVLLISRSCESRCAHLLFVVWMRMLTFTCIIFRITGVAQPNHLPFMPAESTSTARRAHSTHDMPMNVAPSFQYARHTHLDVDKMCIRRT